VDESAHDRRDSQLCHAKNDGNHADQSPSYQAFTSHSYGLEPAALPDHSPQLDNKKEL